MKLILANNTTQKFLDFYAELDQQRPGLFEYANYTSLLFMIDTNAERRLRVINIDNNKTLMDYDGVYINGYLNTYELAAATAIACQAADVPFVNQELRDAPSLSKLTSYAKLAAAGVRLPRSIAGTSSALLAAGDNIDDALFPAVLKRADADRGVDNFKVDSASEIAGLLEGHDRRSLWILQEYIPNDGFFLVNYYGGQPKFCVFRSMGQRADGNVLKAHMFKPRGGSNASLIPLSDVPEPIIAETDKAIAAMNRQIGSVDCLYDQASETVHILEVNYNPQMATVQTFRDVRLQAYLDNLEQDWS